jgi:hypothetical protein
MFVMPGTQGTTHLSETAWYHGPQERTRPAPSMARSAVQVVVAIVTPTTAAWKKVDPAAIRAMAHSMPTRLEECIAKDGGRTRW